ncbi:TonB-dependent receptor domain-containing protein [Phocaeicola sp.]
MRIICIIFISAYFLSLSAQNSNSGKDNYLAAEEAYRDGQFEKAIRILETDIKSYDKVLVSNVYRLLALCYMATDQEEKVDEYVRLLLRYVPYYTVSLQDPERFADIIRKYKEGKKTLVTASQQIETLEEAPVPVTLITEEMIRAIDANNLKDVLVAYVPGITAVEGNSELNFAMHGVYSSEQQKVLIMQNGHRLNSRSTNVQAPDYSISLEKVKQIEVLRGPASSLYGNAALTAVVNIITKEGKDMDGASLSLGTGSFSTYKADLLIGKYGPNMDFIGWASVFSSEGQKIFYPADVTGIWRIFPMDGYAYINGFNRKPSYDIGCIFQWNEHWKISFSHQYSKMQSPYAYVAVKAPYTYEKYRRINGQKPGHGRTSTRGEMQYSNFWKDYSLNINAYFDADRQMNYEADGDSLPPGLVVYFAPDEIMDSIVARSGFFQMNSWEEYTYGISVRNGYSYGKNKGAHGTLLAGLQMENYTMKSADACIGEDFDRIMVTISEHNGQIKLGSELSLSAFLQGKHYFTSRLIVNGGLRYDYKHRFNGKTLHAFSPRLACIYRIGQWNVKFCYARAFVDAPFFYRASEVVTYKGSEDLEPEYLDALQLSTTVGVPSLHLEYDCNLYYNKLSGIIYYDKAAKEEKSDRPVYSNAGSLELFGIENSVFYTSSKLKVRMNLTYQRVLKSEKYCVTGSKVDAIPAVTMNLVVSQSIFSTPKQSLWGHCSLSCYSTQNMPVSAYKDGIAYKDEAYRIKSTALLNATFSYRYDKLETSLSCNNILNTRYTRGSLYNIDVPQLGRNIMWKIKCFFK